jgi:hypothetical protein
MNDLYEKLPVKGEIWQHTKSGDQYVIDGSSYNAITDKIDVVYLPMYSCEFARFTRQVVGHPKAFLSLNEDGAPRFVKVKEASRA